MADLRRVPADKLGDVAPVRPGVRLRQLPDHRLPRASRTLEIDVLREMASRTASATQLEFVVEVKSVVDVDQFYGIEIGEFPARIAATALWMMDHIMNNRLSLEFGQTYARIPIEKSPHICNADALEIDWADVLPPDECSYVFGNPPFGGAKFQSPDQRAQVRRVAALGGSGRTLDYVAAWFIRAGDYVRRVQPRDGGTSAADRLRGDQLDHAGRAGGATLAPAA